MVAALVLVSLIFSTLGAMLAAFADLGVAMGITSFIAGGMVGTAGFVMVSVTNRATTATARRPLDTSHARRIRRA